MRVSVTYPSVPGLDALRDLIQARENVPAGDLFHARQANVGEHDHYVLVESGEDRLGNGLGGLLRYWCPEQCRARAFPVVVPELAKVRVLVILLHLEPVVQLA